VANAENPVFVGMGRSKMPMLLAEDGRLFYGEDRPTFTPGTADVLREGDDGAILACGPLVQAAVEAHDQVLRESDRRIRVVNMASLRPIDREAVLAAAETGLVITAEDHHVDTGLGARVATILAEEGISVWFHRCGVDRYGASARPQDLYRAFNLDGPSLARLCQ
jgi:transketolase